MKINEARYNKRDIQKAQESLIYRRRLGYPRPDMFLKQLGTIADSPVSPQDGARGMHIYGHGIGYYKGKEVTRAVHFPDVEEIPRVIDKLQRLHMDIMFIFGVAF